MSVQINHPDNPAPEDTQTWTTAEMQAEFEVLAFLAPFVEVRRKSDGAVGMLQFDGMPRVYHSPDFDVD